jgi:hypothetical protein
MSQCSIVYDLSSAFWIKKKAQKKQKRPVDFFSHSRLTL